MRMDMIIEIRSGRSHGDAHRVGAILDVKAEGRKSHLEETHWWLASYDGNSRVQNTIIPTIPNYRIRSCNRRILVETHPSFHHRALRCSTCTAPTESQ